MMSPELETLDQLAGGDLPLDVIRSLFKSDEQFRAAVSAMLHTGKVRLFTNDARDVQHWQWPEVLANSFGHTDYRLGERPV